MTQDLWAAVAAVAVTGYMAFALHRHASTTWFLVRAWRWLSGAAHHGRPVTDAGVFRPGHKALTPTGHAHAWWHLPQWKRAAHRTGGTLAFFGLVYGWMTAPVITLAAVCVAGAGGLAAGCVWLWRVMRAWSDRRTWLHPLHLAAYQVAGHPKVIPARSWISVEASPDGGIRKASLELPPGWPADARDKERLVAIASQKLGIEQPEPAWRLAGPAPLLTLTHSPPPPGHVTMADLLPELASCKPDELLIGVGKNGSLIRASLGTDSPHIAISMGTGAGKSNLAGWLLLQMLLRDGTGLVLDAKRRLSYPWILKDGDRRVVQLPNVAYAWTTAQMHEAMAWLPMELNRRGDVAFAGMDTRGQVHANVGARLFVLAEELNLAVPRLRAWWQENRDPASGDPAKSPAFTGLGEVAFAGRQVRKHLILVGQMLTAEATGSRDSSVKENCGIKLLARYGPKGWRMMAEDIPMPPPPAVLGRVQLVTSGQAREVQTPELDPVEARRLVLASDLALLPAGMPCRPVTVAPPPVLDAVSLPAPETVSVAPAPGPVTLRDAVGVLGILHPSTTVSSLRMARHRDPDFPRRRGVRGRDYLYDAAELAAYDASRRS